ncbi:hypothetical protein ACSYDW_00900 [Paeniglutamicibacter sp. R2-26]|uniref:hypothetical protein n=1 Tax=Paeniglutamicibacter sp. R2-26 TaxID=3144417 RepID=UPI003EE740B3
MDKMSDETGPALSRRALREQRRAEAEAQLALQAEGKEAKAAEPIGKPVVVKPSSSAPAAKPRAGRAVDAAPVAAPAAPARPAEPARPGASVQAPSQAPKSAPKPVAETKDQPATAAAPSKPEVAKPEAAKPAPVKDVPAKVVPSKSETAKPEAAKSAPAIDAAPAAVPAKPVAAKSEPVKPVPAPVKPVPAPEAPAPVATGNAEPARSRRATGGEVDALPQRASLQRARDREALRTRRRLEQEVSELSAKDPSPGDDPAPLTRKQLRLQALGAAAGSTLVEDKAPEVGNTPEPEAPAAAPAPAQAHPSKPEAPKAAAGKPAAAKPEASQKPVPAEPAKTEQAKAEPAKPVAAKPAAPKPAAPAAQMSVEDALALRRRSGGAAPIDPSLAQAPEDLGDVDLEVLAQQRELAARAAIISRRAAERQRLEESNSQRAGQRRSDPFTGSMNMLRDEDIEKKLVNTGISGPVTRGFHISMTDQGTIVDAPAASSAPTKTSAPGAPAPAAKPAEKPAAATPAQAASRESKSQGANPAAAAAPAGAAPSRAAAPAWPMAAGTPAPEARATPKATPLADAHGTVDVEPTVSHPPVRAVRAQGLEPLDAQTAGMRRANNMYLMVIAALSVGGAALVAGLIMILNSN